jgi:hypothetical protein
MKNYVKNAELRWFGYGKEDNYDLITFYNIFGKLKLNFESYFLGKIS